jgi:starch phosphorylase
VLSRLITSAIGPGWITDLRDLSHLRTLAGDGEFCKQWGAAKRENKKRLARYILRKTGLGVNPDALFDVQIKRIHEYKRQLLNLLHIVTLYHRVKDGHELEVPRTFIFAGKAAPAYHQAKLIIKLINSVAEKVNEDPKLMQQLRVIFLPNYCVSQAEKVIPAAELSEQISTAGMEASGTGNMKLTLNGALTIGTRDGANIEIEEEVGTDNLFIFGLSADEVAEKRAGFYDTREIYDTDQELRRTLNMIGQGEFSAQEPALFQPIVRSLLQEDRFMVLADFRSYLSAQERVSRLYQDAEEWTRRSILNTAAMGKFSSDRSIREYARFIWDVSPSELLDRTRGECVDSEVV